MYLFIAYAWLIPAIISIVKTITDKDPNGIHFITIGICAILFELYRLLYRLGKYL